MSLDVDLIYPPEMRETTGVHVRTPDGTRELSWAEWHAAIPGLEPASGYDEPKSVFSWNITHNLNEMAGEAGIYEVLWRPEEVGIVHAGDLIEPLSAGLTRLQADPARFRKLNPPNGWGNYEVLVGFVTAYLAACREYSDAFVRAWR